MVPFSQGPLPGHQFLLDLLMPWSDQNLDSRFPPLTLLGNSPTCPAGGTRSKRQALPAPPGAPGHRVTLRGKDKACSQAPASLQ